MRRTRRRRVQAPDSWLLSLHRRIVFFASIHDNSLQSRALASNT